MKAFAGEFTYRVSTLVEKMRTPAFCGDIIVPRLDNASHGLIYARLQGLTAGTVPELLVKPSEREIIDACLSGPVSMGRENQHFFGSRCQAIKYALGLGVGKSLGLAFNYFQQAVAEGDEWSRRQLPGIVWHMGGGSTPNTIAQLKQMAASGDAIAARYLGNLSVLKGDIQSSQLAGKFYELAAQNGDEVSLCNRGVMFSTGPVAQRAYARAFGYFVKAAQKGEPNAMNNVGLAYELGRGVGADVKQAVQWYRAAADRGSSEAMRNLAIGYEHGIGVKRDLKMADGLYRKAATEGDWVALHKLAR